MQSQEEKEVVINPVTQLPEEDVTIATAIREGNHYITRRGKPRVVVQWHKFMKSRRHYQEIPRYFGLTDQEVQTYMKICNEALVSIRIIGRVWGKHTLEEIIEFVQMKEIPIYRWPKKGRVEYFIFSGDIVRAVESCRIDLKADGGAWPKYMIRKEGARKRAERKREALRYADRSEGHDAGSPDAAPQPFQQGR